MNIRFDKPKKFASFELLEKIGRGATATVYKAVQKSTDRIVALKMGARMLALDKANFARFKREFTAIQHIRHPNLVEALEFGEEKQVPYLVLEYVPGETLERLIRVNGPKPLDEAASIILQVAEGLRVLHQNQLLHRDIKPGNVLITDDGKVKLGDFGLLKALALEPGLTGNRQAMGTVEFGAPEQFEDAKNTDYRCDIYSLATTFYSTLTGYFPFGSGSMHRILQRKLTNKFVPLRNVCPNLPIKLDQLIASSIHSDRTRRPATLDEFVERLLEILTTPEPAQGDPKSEDGDSSKSGPERRRQARVSVALSAAFVPFHQNKRGSFRAIITDVSPGGLCLQTDAPTPINSMVEVTALDNGTSYVAQVRWVKKQSEHEYIVGCSFACTPDPEEMVALTPTQH